MYSPFECNGRKVKGKVVLMRSNALDFNTVTNIRGLIGTGFKIIDSTLNKNDQFVSLQLISATKADGNGNGIVGKQTFLQGTIKSLPTLGAKQKEFDIYFEWDSDMGIPGAFFIRSYMQTEFFLVSLTLEDIPNYQGNLHFVCNSWIYCNTKVKDRIFFANKTYLPGETPTPLVTYRELELQTLRGNGTGKREEWERIYDFDVYNDLGNPDSGEEFARPVLGGSSEYPYPRRGRTGRQSTSKDPKSEKPSSTIYVPRDERFSHLKSSDFLAYKTKSLVQSALPQFESALCSNNAEFNTFEDVYALFDGCIRLHTNKLSKISRKPVLKEMFRTDGEKALKFPLPHVIKVDKSAWMTDEEFAREMIAGINPCVISRLQEFPPKSKLDAKIYGEQTSTITKEHLEGGLDGLTLDEAIIGEKLFILDHHDLFMPYLRKINDLDFAKAYATRAIIFLKNDGTLKPLAIELSLPHPDGDSLGAISRVVLPAYEGVESTIWLLAKSYVVVNDSCYHQIISHWLNTHATIEPIVIATNRNLSVLHPIYKLLLPHYRDTMNINALARQSLINACGTIEKAFLPGPFSMEMSSVAYKNWVFLDQALPADLIKRGMAVEDLSSPHGLRLLIEDYPYAVDGLEIWDAIKTWVQDYVSLYYASDDAIQKDTELQAWWKEAIEKGHGDLKDKPWWPKMQTLEELIQTCSIIIWISSAFHAAVNFGQYPYGGYILNRPTLSRRLIPEKGTIEYLWMEMDPQLAYLRTITPKNKALLNLSTLEMLSMHASDEVYLGQRNNPNWTSDEKAIEAFKKFGNKLAEIEAKILERNNDSSLKNRVGPIQMPYTVLLPSSEKGLTFRGIPNSISI